MNYTNQIYKINAKLSKLEEFKRKYGVSFNVTSINNNILLQSSQQGSMYEITIPEISLKGKKIFGGLIKDTVIREWGDWFDPGIRRKFDATDVYYSDSSYLVLNPESAKDLVKAINHVIREGFRLKWTKEVFDCDEFSDLAVATAGIIALYNGVSSVGIGVGEIKIGFRDSRNRRAGHALCFLPTYTQDIELNFYEPQNTDILSMEDYISHNKISDLTIRQFDM